MLVTEVTKSATKWTTCERLYVVAETQTPLQIVLRHAHQTEREAPTHTENPGGTFLGVDREKKQEQLSNISGWVHFHVVHGQSHFHCRIKFGHANQNKKKWTVPLPCDTWVEPLPLQILNQTKQLLQRAVVLLGVKQTRNKQLGQLGQFERHGKPWNSNSKRGSGEEAQTIQLMRSPEKKVGGSTSMRYMGRPISTAITEPFKMIIRIGIIPSNSSSARWCCLE